MIIKVFFYQRKKKDNESVLGVLNKLIGETKEHFLPLIILYNSPFQTNVNDSIHLRLAPSTKNIKEEKFHKKPQRLFLVSIFFKNKFSKLLHKGFHNFITSASSYKIFKCIISCLDKIFLLINLKKSFFNSLRDNSKKYLLV